MNDVVQVAKALDDIVTNQGAVLVRGAFLESILSSAVPSSLRCSFPRDAYLPQALQAMPCRDESLIASDREQGVEVM